MEEAEQLRGRIAAAKKRLRDLKAEHSAWYRKAPCETTREDDADLINRMEQIAYSVDCYLDGVPGPYLNGDLSQKPAGDGS